ncbi:hypothetical protein ARMSODRAFT_853057, partial [Armillaria solidipes]
LPDFIGGWFPDRKMPAERELYAACILMLFKPWRLLQDLLVRNHTFQTALNDFVSANPFLVDMMENVDYFHKCLNNTK